MTMARFVNGPRRAVQSVPASTVNAGDVIVQENLSLISDLDNPVGSGLSITQQTLYVGGIYQVAADAAYPVGTYVYWDPVGLKVTTKAAGTVPFGWIVAGPQGLASDGGTTQSGDLCFVDHTPQAAPALVLTLGATAADNISNTSAETAFATTAVIPAGTLQPNDVIHVRAVAEVTAQNSTNTNQFKLKISTALNTFTTVVDATALNIAANGLAVFDIDFLVTAVGNTGSFYAVGAFAAGNTGATMASVAKAATAINTNLPVTIEVTDTQSAANVGNVAQLLLLDASIRRK